MSTRCPPSKYKDVFKMLPQRQTNGCINVINSLEMEVLPTSVDSVVTIFKCDVAATFWERNPNAVTTLQSCKFIKCLVTYFRGCVNVVSANILALFWWKAAFMQTISTKLSKNCFFAWRVLQCQINVGATEKIKDVFEFRYCA